MADTLHANNLTNDRALGAYWEERFCELAARHGRSYTANQIGRQYSAIAKDSKFNAYTLPDITVWTAPGEHHEIKHKDPFPDHQNGPSYGLEVYRFNALIWFANETKQSVMYTIHDHKLSGGRDESENRLEHWITTNVLALNNSWHTCRKGFSYVNGTKKEVDIYYWSINRWRPLEDYWNKIATPYTSWAEIKELYPDRAITQIPTNQAKIGDLWEFKGSDNYSFVAEITGFDSKLIRVGTRWVELYPKVGQVNIFRMI